MESLNLHTLANSLPTAQQNAEKELTNNFKAAALSITTLYRSSRKNSKRAYNAGYAAACQDLLTMIQQGVSLNPSVVVPHDPEQGGMTIGRIMDWTEARLEAIKSREEEEDEEEEREKEKEGGGARSKPSVPVTVPTTTKVAKTVASTRSKPQPSSLPTPNSPRSSQPQPSEPSSPSPPPPAALRPIQRPLRPRSSAKGELAQGPIPMHMDFRTDSGPSIISQSDIPIPIPIPIAAGAKRRHAMMMMLDPPATSAVSIDGSVNVPHSSPPAGHTPLAPGGGNGGAGSGSSRRRTRSSRHNHNHNHNPQSQNQNQNQNQNISISQATSEAMDIEEDGGRERKRVARR